MSTNTQAISDDIMETARWIAADQCGADDQCAFPSPCSCRDQIAKAIHDAVMAERERNRWQPIETLPDGDELVLLALRGGGVCIAPPPVQFSREDIRKAHLEIYKYTGKLENHADYLPTHWQPLPSAPKAEE